MIGCNADMETCEYIISGRTFERRAVRIFNRQESSRLGQAQRKHRTSELQLYVKLTSLFGITWVSMVIFAFTLNTFVEYLAVILNSLQGRSYIALSQASLGSFLARRIFVMSPRMPV